MKFKLDHIGYLTDSIEKSIITFELLGYEKGDSLFDNIQNIKLQFLKNNNTTIELIEPQKDSKIYNLLNKYNNIFYHTAYKVNNIDETISELKKSTIIKPLTPKMDSDFFKKHIQFFLLNQNIIELIEE